MAAGPGDLTVQGVFICCGKKRPGTGFLGDLLDTDDGGYLQVDGCCETPIPGVYAIGDVRRHRFHQVGTAVGDGTVAGMDALRHLKKTAA